MGRTNKQPLKRQSRHHAPSHHYATIPSQRPPVLFGPPSLDSLYERDLSGLTIPVARAAARWSLRRILRQRGILERPVPSTTSDNFDDFEDDLLTVDVDTLLHQPPGTSGGYKAKPPVGVPPRELTFITGVGVAKTKIRARGLPQKRRRSVATGRGEFGDEGERAGAGVGVSAGEVYARDGVEQVRSGGTTTLREYLLHMLRSEFSPPLEADVPEYQPGSVVVRPESLEAWIAAQKEAPTLM